MTRRQERAKLRRAHSNRVAKGKQPLKIPRWLEVSNDEDSWEACLLKTELQRMLKYAEDTPEHFCDLGQEPSKRCRASSESGPLHTLLHGMGITWIPSKRRWWCPSELAQAMGYPVDVDMAKGVGGVNLFTRSSERMGHRTRSFECKAIGNAMHANSAGGVFFAIMRVTLRPAEAVHAPPALGGRSGGDDDRDVKRRRHRV